jgi:Ca2+-binding RTX toxin-like protein
MLAVDLALNALQMASGGDHGVKLAIAYDITGSSSSKLNASIRLYESTTGTTLETFSASLPTGTGKTFNIQPHYFDAFQDDYELMADVTLTSVSEPNTSNNTATFGGGVFLSKWSGPWGASIRFVEMFGTSSDDTFTVKVLSTSGTDVVRVTDGIGGTYDYSTSVSHYFIARLQEGNDTIQAVNTVAAFNYFVAAFGGDGNDTVDLAAQTNTKALHGGTGDDTFIIGNGSGQFFGESGSDTYQFVSNTNTDGYTYQLYESASDTGTDTLDFSALTVTVTIDLNNTTSDQLVTPNPNGLKIRLSEIAFENLIT